MAFSFAAGAEEPAPAAASQAQQAAQPSATAEAAPDEQQAAELAAIQGRLEAIERLLSENQTAARNDRAQLQAELNALEQRLNAMQSQADQREDSRAERRGLLQGALEDLRQARDAAESGEWDLSGVLTSAATRVDQVRRLAQTDRADLEASQADHARGAIFDAANALEHRDFTQAKYFIEQAGQYVSQGITASEHGPLPTLR